MLFGTPQATSFLIWEAWPPATTDNTNIFDNNWNLRDSGEALVSLLNAWTTPTQTLTVGPDGMIDFTPATALAPQATADGDGDTDGADFLVWQRNLGQAPWQPLSSPAPEPARRLMLLAASGLLQRFRRTARAGYRRNGLSWNASPSSRAR